MEQPQYFKEGQTAYRLMDGEFMEGIILYKNNLSTFPILFESKDGTYTAFFTYDGRVNTNGSVCLFQKPFHIPQNIPLADEFQVGDRVKCKIHGFGNVVNIEAKDNYSVKVKFDKFDEYFDLVGYTLEGRLNINDYEPILTKI